MNSLVSVVIPCYNAEKWLAQAIDSCLAQTYRPVEVIIIDDGSTDNSVNVAQGYAEKLPSLIRFHQQVNQGAPAARNAGATLARGAFLLFLDADDYLLKGALHHLVKAFKGGGDIAYGGTRLVDCDGIAFGIRHQKPQSRDWVVAMIETHPITSSILFRREAIRGCEWDPQLPCAQEYALLVSCAVRGAVFRFTPTVVAAIREHASPGRISNKTNRILAETLITLHLRFRSELARQGCLDAARNASLHYAILNDAISLWRFGCWRRAREVFTLIDKRVVRESRRFNYLSYHGIASVAGLRTSEIVWRSRQWLRQFALGLRPSTRGLNA